MAIEAVAARLGLKSTFDDSYSQAPLRAASFGHAIAEATAALPNASWFKPLSIISVAYIGVAAFSRSQRAAHMERHPELVRKAKVSAAMDSLGTTWLESITLPSLAIGTLHRVMASSTPVIRTATALTCLPLLIPASSYGADLLMDWAFRPAIAYMAQPSAAILAPSSGAEYVPPPPEALLGGMSDSMLLGGPDLDPLARARMEWALDGNAGSAFPEEQDVPSTVKGPAVAAAGAASLKGLTGPKASSSGSPSEAETAYISAVAEIKARAEARRTAALKAQAQKPS